MFKTALNKNIIPYTWKLANIVPIPKPNKDTDKGTSYRPISLLSVIAKKLEKSLLPYITANIPSTPMHLKINNTALRMARKHVCICDICHIQIQVRKPISIRCNRIEHWVNLRCPGVRLAQYADTWTYHQHK